MTGVAAAEGEQPNKAGADAAPLSVQRSSTGPPPADTASPLSEAAPESFSLEGLLLLDSEDNEATAIEVLTFAADGVGVTRSRGERARVLPWSSVIGHAVEPWSGGVVPEWWVDPELNRRGARPDPVDAITDPNATNRSRPGREPGALIAIQTSTQTYRFLCPGGDATEISHQITDLAVRFQGPTGASSVTRVVQLGKDAERRRWVRPRKRNLSWSRIQPFLVVALILFLVAAVTVILLQSAGTIHLPYLGGIGSGVVGSPTTGLPGTGFARNGF